MLINPVTLIKARKAFVIAHGLKMNGIFETTQDCEKFFDSMAENEYFTTKFYEDYSKRQDS